MSVSWPPKVAELLLAVPVSEPVEFNVDSFGGLGENLLLMRPSSVLLSVWVELSWLRMA